LPGVALLAFAGRNDGIDPTEQPAASVGHEPPD
jgi:hypothetical protein